MFKRGLYRTFVICDRVQRSSFILQFLEVLLILINKRLSLEEFDLHAALAAHDLNHQAKDILKGKNPCQVFHEETRRIRFTIPERKVVYDWINKAQESILKEAHPIFGLKRDIICWQHSRVF